jgi:uncharacterized membrane protein
VVFAFGVSRLKICEELLWIGQKSVFYINGFFDAGIGGAFFKRCPSFSFFMIVELVYK